MGDPRDDAIINVVREQADTIHADLSEEHDRNRHDNAAILEQMTTLHNACWQIIRQMDRIERRMDSLERKSGGAYLFDKARQLAEAGATQKTMPDHGFSRPVEIDTACSADPAEGPVMVLVPELGKFGLEIEPDPGSDPTGVWPNALDAISAARNDSERAKSEGYAVNVSPSGIRRMSIVLGDTLHIWVGDSLDDITRERYIQQKLDLHRIKRRRHALLPLLLPASGGHAVWLSKAATSAAALGSGAIALSLAAAITLPTVFDDALPARKRPLAAAPAPTDPPTVGHPPVSSSSNPRIFAHPVAASVRATRRVRMPLSITVDVTAMSTKARVRVPRVLHVHTALPIAASTLPTRNPRPATRQQAPLLGVTLPRAGVRLSAGPTLPVRLPLGSGQR